VKNIIQLGTGVFGLPQGCPVFCMGPFVNLSLNALLSLIEA